MTNELDQIEEIVLKSFQFLRGYNDIAGKLIGFLRISIVYVTKWLVLLAGALLIELLILPFLFQEGSWIYLTIAWDGYVIECKRG